MEKEVILSKIALLLDREQIIIKKHGLLLGIYRCCGMDEVYDKYSDYLNPYWYRESNGWTYENEAVEYNVYMGLDYSFRYLLCKNQTDKLIEFLCQLTDVFNTYLLTENDEVFEKLSNLYGLLGLELSIEFEKIKCDVARASCSSATAESFSMENWLQTKYSDIYASYKGAIDSFVDGNAGACIESCRTTLVGIFSKFKGTEDYAKWMRGIFNVSGENRNASTGDLNNALNNELRKEDLATFFRENKDGKLTKTKAIYTIYSMMSDYGTHRVEGTIEEPSQEDALFMIRLLESILYWIFSITK